MISVVMLTANEKGGKTAVLWADEAQVGGLV